MQRDTGRGVPKGNEGRERTIRVLSPRGRSIKSGGNKKNLAVGGEGASVRKRKHMEWVLGKSPKSHQANRVKKGKHTEEPAGFGRKKTFIGKVRVESRSPTTTQGELSLSVKWGLRIQGSWKVYLTS